MPGAPNGGLFIPEDIDAIRSRWFQAGFWYITQQEWDREWRWVSHFYTCREVIPSKEGETVYYRCFFNKKAPTKSGGEGKRGKLLRATVSCPCTLSKRGLRNGTFAIAIRQGHCHTMDDIEQANFPLAIKEHIVYLLSTGHSPHSAEHQLRGRACSLEARDRLSAAGGRNITIRHIKHLAESLGLKQRDARRARILTASKVTEYEAALAELRASGRYLVETIAIADSRALVFIRPNSLEALKKYGYFAIMDATHKTVRWGWNLFTIMVRDGYGSWLPTACFFTEQQTGRVISACLRVIIKWCGGLGSSESWALRYLVTDDSAAEQNAVRDAFGHHEDGSPRVQHLLCTKHSWETLKRNIPAHNPECLRHMGDALFARRTEQGCRQSVEAAIACAYSQRVADYLRNNWLADTRPWARWVRDPIPLLCQITTTNPVEGWHSKLKNAEAGLKQMMSRSWDLAGVIKHIDHCIRDYEEKADRVKFRSVSYKTPLALELSGWGFEQLPTRIGLSVLRQYRLAQHRVYTNQRIDLSWVSIPGWQPRPADDDGQVTGGPAVAQRRGMAAPNVPSLVDVGEVEWDDPEQRDDPDYYRVVNAAEEADQLSTIAPIPGLGELPRCKCRWFRAWQLPCAHIWHHHLLENSLRPSHFQRLFELYRQHGFDFYRDIQRPPTTLEEPVDVPRQSLLQIQEVSEVLRSTVYSIRDQIQLVNGSREELEMVLGGLFGRVQQDLQWLGSLDIPRFIEQQRQFGI